MLRQLSRGAQLSTLAAALAVQPASAEQGGQAQLKPLVINEVLFDELGTDAIGETEFVELYASTQLNLGQYSIASLSGSFTFQLPAGTISAGTHVVVFLGDHVPYGFQTTVTTGVSHVAVAAGIGLGDHLDNAADGVRLQKNGNGQDEVSWGVGSPPSGANAATWFNTAYSGGSPVRPGDSIGRSKTSSYTGSAADWARGGGRNAAGPTIGLKNVVPLASTSDLHEWAEVGFNTVIAGLNVGSIEFNWAEITSASFTGTQSTQTTDSVDTTAPHSLVIEVYGTPQTYSGVITVNYDRSTVPGQTSIYAVMNGTLTAPDGSSFSLYHAESRSGFQANSNEIAADTEFTWITGGNAYSMTCAAAQYHTRLGQNLFEVQDFRDATDWGDAGNKHSEAYTTLSQVWDGVFASSGEIYRPREVMPPPFAEAGEQEITADVLLAIDATVTITPTAAASEITRWDYYEDGVRLTTLQPGEHGSVTESISVDGAGVATITSSYGFPVRRSGIDREFWGDLSATASNVGGKIITEGTYTVGRDAESFTRSLYFDPPVQSGGGGGKSFGGFFGALVDCATAEPAIGGLGAAAGAVVGGLAGAGAMMPVGIPCCPPASVPLGGNPGGIGGAILCGIEYLCGLWNKWF